MKTIIYSAIPNNGVIKIPLLTECTCEIGLVSLSLPNINRSTYSDVYQEIDVLCDQVDSTYLNSKRLLRKICTEKTNKYFNNFEFKNILYFNLDSSDRKLTIRINDQFGPIQIPQNVLREANPKSVTLVLHLRPITDQNDRWIKYI